VSLLAAYRRQLAEEAAGNSDHFARFVHGFRVFWLGSVVLGIAVAGLFILQAVVANDPAAGWGIIIGPVFGILIMLAGRIPYGLAQLFFSVKADDRG
jgi:hypothetical protein